MQLLFGVGGKRKKSLRRHKEEGIEVDDDDTIIYREEIQRWENLCDIMGPDWRYWLLPWTPEGKDLPRVDGINWKMRRTKYCSIQS